MTPDEELQLLRADWAALVAQVSGGEGANLRRDETHPNSRGEVMQPEPACPHIRSSGPADRATHWCALAATPPAAPTNKEKER